jgi:hypothetical protein
MPWQHKFLSSNCLQGIKQVNLSLQEKFIEKPKLLFTLEELQLHLISQIGQGCDSIFYVGVGYGKSLIFEDLTMLEGKGINGHTCHSCDFFINEDCLLF